MKELSLERKFAPVTPGIHSIRKPTTVIDRSGRILAWILPDLLPSAIQASRIFNPKCFVPT